MDRLSTAVADWARYGTRLALVEAGRYRLRRYNYAEILGLAWSLRERLLAMGLAPGDRVLLWGEAGAGWAVAFHACLLSGLVAAPVDASATAAFAAGVAREVEARLVLAGASAAAALAERLPCLPRLRFDELLAAPPLPAPHRLPAFADDTLLEIVYTSGATGEPKGVMITHGNLLANVRALNHEMAGKRRWLGLWAGFGFLHTVPFSHLFGQIMALVVPPLLGGYVIVPASEAPAAVADASRHAHAAIWVAVPRQVQLQGEWLAARMGIEPEEICTDAQHSWPLRLWRWREAHRRFGWRLWGLVVGGAALPPVTEALWTGLGYAVLPAYGLTETAPGVTATHPLRRRAGTAGQPLIGVDVRLAADGEILVRGPIVTPGYYKDPEASAALVRDGWLHTGDLGEWDTAGHLRILGRKKELIVTAAGQKFSPATVEEQLERQPEIRESAVVGEPYGDGVRVHAVLVPAPGHSERLAEAVRRANRELEPHQRVQAFSVWSGESLPRTPGTHKLQRAALAAWLQDPARPHPAPGAGASASLRDFVAARTGVARERVAANCRLEELGIDSLDRVELLNWMEERGYSGPAEPVLGSEATLVDLEQHMRGAPDGAAPARWEGVRPVLYPAWPRRPAVGGARAALWWSVAVPVLATQARVEARGLEHLRELTPPVLFVANHLSRLDVPCLERALPAAWRRRVAPGMGMNDFSGWLLGQGAATGRLGDRILYLLAELFFNAYLLSAAADLRAAWQHSGALADAGFCPLIFPEGRASPDGQLHAFYPGAARLARELALPVVPVRLSGLEQERFRLPRRRTRVCVEFGPALMPAPQAGEDAALTETLEAYYRNRDGSVEPAAIRTA